MIVVPQDPLHHALELRARILQPHDLDSPLVCPPGGGHTGYVPMLLFEGHLVVAVFAV